MLTSHSSMGEMAAYWLPSRMIMLLCFISFFLQPQASEEFIRPPPRRLISIPHEGSKVHPQQVHISLVGTDHMRVSWVTDAHGVPSTVEYGKTPGKYEAAATGEHTSYRFFFYSSGRIHHVKIGPLEPSTIYYYRCGGVGKEFNFKTPPPSFPIEFAVSGDLGQTEWTASTLAHISSSDYDVLLLPGDLSYADLHQPLWDSFGRLVAALASQRPWMVTQGNHEIEQIPVIGPKAFKSFNARWRMPFEESGSQSNLYYSFEVAGVHVIMLGSYTEFDASSAQFKWLEADLGKVDRKRTPWLVALLHAPWYNTNTAHQGEGESMREAMEALLYNARTDIVFAGHVHAYERFTRVYNNSADPCGPMHVTIGDGGNREGLALLFKIPTSPLSLFREASFGHGRLRMFNETHARWSWNRNDDSVSTVRDEVWLESLATSHACTVPQPKVMPTSNRDEL